MKTMHSDRQRVDAPLLGAYLREASSWPTSMPNWIVPVGFAVGGLVLLICQLIKGVSGLAWPAAFGAGWLAVHLLRGHFEPRDEVGKAEAMRYEALRKLQHINQQGLRKRLPPEVLIALEAAVTARNSALARVHTEEPHVAATATDAIDASLQACLVAAAKLARDDETSKREWEAILNNRAAVGEVVDVIEAQTLRMRNGAWGGHERLAALRELGPGSDLDALRLNQ